MLKKVLLFTLSVFGMALFAHAQERLVTGKVTFENESLPGVNILIKDATTGTITDIDGKYQIIASPEDVLVFSYVGFLSEEVQVGNQSEIDVILSPNLSSLEEIVVVGYGEMKKSDVTGSVVSVKGEDLNVAVASSFNQALDGRAAGVVVDQSSGQPGGVVSVRIRGVSSISGTNEPLYVIDGVPVSGSSTGTATGFSWAGGGNGQTALNGLSGFNPNDIESIEVLKDASATAIYGSRAANGVILITTKRGQSGRTRVNYDAYYGLQQFPKKIDVLNLQEFAQYSNQLDAEEGRTPRPEFADPSILGEGTDWQEEIYELAPLHKHDLTFNGGSENTRFLLSMGYLDQDGIIIGSGFKRYTGRLNLDHQVNDWLKVGVSLSGSKTDERVTLNDDVWGVVALGLTQTPDVPVKNADGSWGGPIANDNSQYNPVAIAMIRDLAVERIRILSNFYANAEIIDGLVFTTKLGLDRNNTNNYGFNPTWQMGPNVVNNQNQSNRSYGVSNYWIWSNYLTYNTTLANQLDITAMVGQEAQESNWEGISGGRKNFVTNDIPELNAGDAITATNGQYKGSSALASYYGRLQLRWADKYLITSTLRYDGSSKFAEGKKWGALPSFAVAW